MISLRLWHAVLHPPLHHPLFARTIRVHSALKRGQRIAAVFTLYICVCAVITFVWPLFVANPLVVVITAVVAANVLSAMFLATNISTTIAREHEANTYDLLCIQPAGSLGAGWALSTGCMHHNSLLRAARLLARTLWVVAAAGLTITAVLAAIFVFVQPHQETLQLSTALLAVFLAALVVYVNHVQSMVMAYLIGMITPTFTENQIYTRLWATAGFLLVETGAHFLTLLLAFAILPRLYSALGFFGLYADFSVFIFSSAASFCVHETVISGAWRLLKQRFNANRAELNSLLEIR